MAHSLSCSATLLCLRCTTVGGFELLRHSLLTQTVVEKLLTRDVVDQKIIIAENEAKLNVLFVSPFIFHVGGIVCFFIIIIGLSGIII